MLSSFSYFQFFIIGICIGSFLNVIIYRFQKNFSIIKPRSFCPKCKKQLTWRENIPLVSYLIQGGKCIGCSESISIRYPLVELITGTLFIFFAYSSPTFYNFSQNPFLITFFSWLFLSLLICISLIDMDSFWIPQGLINFGFVFGILGLICLDIFKEQSIDFSLTAIGLTTAAISFLIFEFLRLFAKYIFKKDALGKGDSKLIAMLALWLGPMGTLLMVGLSYIFAAAFCFLGLSMNFLRLRQAIPFAPFLSLGGLVVWLLGNKFIMEKILHI